MNGLVAPALMFQWPPLMCEVLCLAAPVFSLWVSGGAAAPVPALLVRARVVVRYAAILALLWSAPALLSETAQMAGTPLFAAAAMVPMVVTGTHAGRLWLIRIVLYIALAAAGWGARLPRPGLRLAAIIAGALMLVRALGSHAIDHGSIAVAAYWAHELAASAWLGALAGLAVGLRGLEPALAAQTLNAATPRVSRIAGWCVAILIVTGGYAGWYSLGLDLGHVLYSAFGRTLIVKLAIAAAAILLGGYNRRILLPRLSEAAADEELLRNVAAESLLLILALACSSVLAATPPAH